MSARETINGVLVYLFNEIWELEERAIITEEFQDITNNDMHVIEAVGTGGQQYVCHRQKAEHHHGLPVHGHEQPGEKALRGAEPERVGPPGGEHPADLQGTEGL